MGWWSPTILGGDAPCDAAYDIAEQFGGYTRGWDSWDGKPQVLKANLECVDVEKLKSFIDSAYEPGIAAQVVAYVHMAVGAKLPTDLRTAAIEACNLENTSGWSDPKNRQDCLKQFSDMVRDYDDATSQRPAEKGLFDALGEHLSTGDAGLLNDNCNGNSLA